jgi:hypothetical protein
VARLDRFDDPDFNAHVDGFLDSVAGPKGMRASLAVQQAKRAVSLTNQMQTLTANLDRYRA